MPEGTKSKEELEKSKTVALGEQKSILSEILEPDSIDVSIIYYLHLHVVTVLIKLKNVLPWHAA